jgi:hypothetical protein
MLRLLLAIPVLALAACTAITPPVARAHDEPFAIPQDLTWQYATSCMMQMTSEGTVVGLQWDETGIEVRFEDETAETLLDQQRLKNCFAQYRTEQRADSFSYVDAFERAQLWDYYSAVTEPCLTAHGVTVPALTRAQFFVPDQRPWNPYTAMDDLPFEELVALYQACPPIPDYLAARHEP